MSGHYTGRIRAVPTECGGSAREQVRLGIRWGARGVAGTQNARSLSHARDADDVGGSDARGRRANGVTNRATLAVVPAAGDDIAHHDVARGHDGELGDPVGRARRPARRGRIGRVETDVDAVGSRGTFVFEL